MSTKITRINQIAREKPKEVFTSIYHLINKELLEECFNELDGNKAIGIDGITKQEYKEKLNENLENIVTRLKNKSYKPSPARKVNIPKANGKLRVIAIANFEDKIVQMATKKIIEAIYEPRFTNNMFGFRPNRSCHDALRYLNNCIENKYTNYILDADIRGYFDNIDHEKLMKCLEMHIKDTNLQRLIRRFLKAGIMENGVYVKGEKGTPQGSILSPVLANIYMYYTLILWFEIEIKPKYYGYIEIVNYADDMVICFQYEKIGKAVYELMRERLKVGGLEFAEEKTRLLEFGRYAEENRKKRGEGKPETFNFLGFTHYCSKSDKTGKFRVKRKTEKKKFKQKIQEYKIWIKQNRNKPLKEIMEITKKKLTGHYNYYGITDNFENIQRYKYEIGKLLMKWLNRRSQKKSYDSKGFTQMIERYKLPIPRIKINIYAI